MNVTRIELYRLDLPLLVPYRLSFGPVTVFSSLVALAELADGSGGVGECTPLFGYSTVTLEHATRRHLELARACIGRPAGHVYDLIRDDGDGFAHTALVSAVEDASGLFPRQGGDVPLVGHVQEMADESPEDALERARRKGYAVFKLKVGFLELSRDVSRLRRFQDALRPGELLRTDANQALEERQAVLLAENMDPACVELFEQPFPVDRWEAMARLRRVCPVPLMLDESITSPETLDRAADVAHLVKLKWMKQGGWRALSAMADRAKGLGLGVVFGNGVAGFVNNLQESLFWLAHLADQGRAGEMNGFLKIADRPRGSALSFAAGVLSLSGPEHGDIREYLRGHDAQTLLTLEA